MRAAPLVVLALVLFTGSYMAFDGARAIATGEYITPDSGEYAGELGPWAYIVAAFGLDPEGTPMKVVFVIWGVTWCVLAALHVHRPDRWWLPLTIWSFASAWYLIVGTVFALAAGGILVSPWGRPHTTG